MTPIKKIKMVGEEGMLMVDKRHYLSNKGSVSAAFQNKRDSIKSCQKTMRELSRGHQRNKKNDVSCGCTKHSTRICTSNTRFRTESGQNFYT
jgi:hypothetical protein